LSKRQRDAWLLAHERREQRPRIRLRSERWLGARPSASRSSSTPRTPSGPHRRSRAPARPRAPGAAEGTRTRQHRVPSRIGRLQRRGRASIQHAHPPAGVRKPRHQRPAGRTGMDHRRGGHTQPARHPPTRDSDRSVTQSDRSQDCPRSPRAGPTLSHRRASSRLDQHSADARSGRKPPLTRKAPPQQGLSGTGATGVSPGLYPPTTATSRSGQSRRGSRVTSEGGSETTRGRSSRRELWALDAPPANALAWE
jgi:hypothetical protein